MRDASMGALSTTFDGFNCVEVPLMLLSRGGELMLRALTMQLGNSDRVTFADFHADPSPFYAAADLLVLSPGCERFGNVTVEALSFGVPVVSTDCPSSPSEILEHDHYGILVPVGDAVVLAIAVDEALSRPHDREALKRRARDFNPEKVAATYLDLLMPRTPGEPDG